MLSKIRIFGQLKKSCTVLKGQCSFSFTVAVSECYRKFNFRSTRKVSHRTNETGVGFFSIHIRVLSKIRIFRSTQNVLHRTKSQVLNSFTVHVRVLSKIRIFGQLAKHARNLKQVNLIHVFFTQISQTH